MEQFSNKIEGIRRVMEDLKGEEYALTNSELVDLDEYIKALYLKMLCTVVHFGGDPAEMQILYLNRILHGMRLEGTVEEHMRKALEISDTDIREFVTMVKEGNIRYYFTLDGLLLASMGYLGHSRYGYLAEIIEVIDVTKDDLEYLCLVAKSVLQQQSSLYDDAKMKRNQRVEQADFTPYLKNYYAGAIIDTDQEAYYSAPDKKLSDTIEYPIMYKDKKVVFENVAISMDKDWVFERCEEVVFKNCDISTASKWSNRFKSVDTITIENCTITGFQNRFARTTSVNNLYIYDSEFINCGCNGKGGIIYAEGENFSNISIERNKFLDCRIRKGKLSFVGGLLIYFDFDREYDDSYSVKELSLIANEFVGCKFDEHGWGSSCCIIDGNGTNKLKRKAVHVHGNTCTDPDISLFGYGIDSSYEITWKSVIE